jgi:hypothetical protein
MARRGVPIVMLFPGRAPAANLTPSAVIDVAMPNGITRNSLATDSMGIFM